MSKDYKKKHKKNLKKELHNKHDKNKDKNLFCIGSSKKSSDCKNANQCLMNNVKKECTRGNNASEALRNLDRKCITK